MKHKNNNKYLMINKKAIIDDIVANIQSENREEASSLINKYNISIQEIYKTFDNLSILEDYYQNKEFSLITKDIDNNKLKSLKLKNEEYNHSFIYPSISVLIALFSFMFFFNTTKHLYSDQLIILLSLFGFPFTLLSAGLFLKVKNIKRINKINKINKKLINKKEHS